MDLLLGNESTAPVEGWIRLVRYGDFQHENGVQRFARADAEQIVNDYRAPHRAIQRILGIPWYIGHPDHPAFRARYLDTRAYGRIKDLDVREDGLWANVRWSRAGEALIRDEAFSGHSLNWGCRRDAAGYYRPVRIKSVGFTNEPNIPTDPITLANSTDKTNNDTMNPELLKKLGLAADATEEQTLAAIDALSAAKAAAETALANEQAAKAAAETALANERKLRIAAHLDAAVQAGRILPADRPRWAADIETAPDLAAKLTELANKKPVLKTASVTTGLGERKGERAASDKIVELVNERMEAANEDWPAAWAAVKRSHPALFEELSSKK